MFRIPVRPDLELRHCTFDDAEPVFALVEENRDYLRRWLPWVYNTHSPADIGNWIRSGFEQMQRNEGWHALLCYEGRIAGALGFKPIDWANMRVEIGYWLAAAFQGKGLMTAAARAATDYAFAEWRLNRIEIHCAVGNTRSAAIPRRLGFAEEGMLRRAFRVGDEFQDLLLFGVLRDEWNGGGR
jgi:ribosomal-protein-serine acetyltransferase